MEKHTLYYSFLGLCLVQKLDVLGFFPPVLHILPTVHIYLICCFSVSFLQLLHAFFKYVIRRKKNCLLCPPFLLTCVCTALCTAAAVRAETAKSETPGSQNNLLCSALLCCFLHDFFWVFCCFFYWWANARNQTSLPTFVCMFLCLGWRLLSFHLSSYLKELNDSL